jgi:hypothetical protein
MSALVEKKTGLDGSRTLIQAGLCAWCNAGSLFVQDISKKVTRYGQVTKVKTFERRLKGYNNMAVMLSEAKHL